MIIAISVSRVRNIPRSRTDRGGATRRTAVAAGPPFHHSRANASATGIPETAPAAQAPRVAAGIGARSWAPTPSPDSRTTAFQLVRSGARMPGGTAGLPHVEDQDGQY